MQPQLAYINSATGAISAHPTSLQPPSIVVILGTTLDLHLAFLTAGALNVLADYTADSLRLVVKASDALDASASLFEVGTWTIDGSGASRRYKWRGLADSEQLQALIGSAPQITLSATVEWQVSTDDNPRKTTTCELIVLNSPARIGDGAPDIAGAAAKAWLAGLLEAGTNVTLSVHPTTGVITIASSSSGVTDGDKGSITVSSSGTVWTLKDGAVTESKIGTAAINESHLQNGIVSNGKLSGALQTEIGLIATKANASTTISAAGLATGGGSLSSSRTITVPAATQAEAEAGSSNLVVITPARNKQYIDARIASQAEAEAGTNTSKLMTPQRVAQAIAALAGGGGGSGGGLITRIAYVDINLGNDTTGSVTTGAPYLTLGAAKADLSAVLSGSARGVIILGPGTHTATEGDWNEYIHLEGSGVNVTTLDLTITTAATFLWLHNLSLGTLNIQAPIQTTPGADGSACDIKIHGDPSVYLGNVTVSAANGAQGEEGYNDGEMTPTSGGDGGDGGLATLSITGCHVGELHLNNGAGGIGGGGANGGATGATGYAPDTGALRFFEIPLFFNGDAVIPAITVPTNAVCKAFRAPLGSPVGGVWEVGHCLYVSMSGVPSWSDVITGSTVPGPTGW